MLVASTATTNTVLLTDDGWRSQHRLPSPGSRTN
jgi:hypothetical protein